VQTNQAFLDKVLALIERHLGDEQFSVAELSRAVGLSRSQLHRKLLALQQPAASELIRATFGTTPSQWRREKS